MTESTHVTNQNVLRITKPQDQSTNTSGDYLTVKMISGKQSLPEPSPTLPTEKQSMKSLQVGRKPKVGDFVYITREECIEDQLEEVTGTNLSGFKTKTETWRRYSWENDAETGWYFPSEVYFLHKEKVDNSVETNKHGAKQSKVDYAFHLLPADAMLKIASVFKQGADRYGVDNWLGLSVDDCLNHALGHGYKHISGDDTEEHLANMACRAIMALQLHIGQDM